METIILNLYDQIPNIAPILFAGYIVHFNSRHSRLELNILRLRILTMIQHFPTQSSIIKKLYSEYKKKGGNCEIDDIFQIWHKKYGELGD